MAVRPRMLRFCRPAWIVDPCDYIASVFGGCIKIYSFYVRFGKCDLKSVKTRPVSGISGKDQVSCPLFQHTDPESYRRSSRFSLHASRLDFS